jgi:preprotein translocase subunit YajC
MPQGQTINPLLQFVPLLLIFAIFYFMLIRPQKKREKEHQKMLDSLTKNDEIVTTGGIHGTVVNVKEKTIILRIDENVKVEVERSCIAFVKKPQAPAK